MGARSPHHDLLLAVMYARNANQPSVNEQRALYSRGCAHSISKLCTHLRAVH